jgi:DNA polymerase epsilon subunit 2
MKQNATQTCRSQFGKLGQMIGAHERLKEHSRFMFIPGPEDAGRKTMIALNLLMYSVT